MNKIVIWAGYPPPYGGVSIFIKRFIEYLKRNEIEFSFYNSIEVLPKDFFLTQLNFQEKLIHVEGFQSWRIQLLLLILIFFFNKKVIVHIQNDRFLQNYNSLNILFKIIAKIFFSNIDRIIALNPHTDFGFVAKSKIKVLPSYIPPLESEADVELLPKEIIAIHKSIPFLITANASRIPFYNNQDLYGIDLCIELTRRLVENGYEDIGFLYVISNITDFNYFNKMKQLVVKYDIQKYFFFYTKPIAYPAVLRISNLFIRPTNTDGYGYSIAEAIDLGTPAIASDVCKRPEATVLFRSRDIDELFEKTREIIENYDYYKKRIKNIKFEDDAEKIVKLYEEVLGS